jgi:hypothetical protein
LFEGGLGGVGKGWEWLGWWLAQTIGLLVG